MSKRTGLPGLLAVLAVFFSARYLAGVMDIGLGGPLATVIAVAAAHRVVRWEGGGWGDLGVAKPVGWLRALAAFVIAFAITAGAGLILMSHLIGIFGEPEPSGRFDYLHGNLPGLVLSVVGVAWIAAAFGEEVLFRGFFLPRLASILGGGAPAWISAVTLQAALFAALHAGVVGATVAGVIGLAYGFLYWWGRGNVLPLVVAHAIPDTISFVSVYQGGH